jgi:hypothetical protein
VCVAALTSIQDASYWAFSAVGNWMAKARKYIHPDIAQLQSELEGSFLEAQNGLEERAAELVTAGAGADACDVLTEAVEGAAARTHAAYSGLFETFIARYHDGYIMSDPHAEIISVRVIVYSEVLV